MRQQEAERFGVRARILDCEVECRRPKPEGGDSEAQGRALASLAPEPSPGPLNGAMLLDSMTGAIRDHIVLPVHAAETAALWAVHCHIFDATDVTPRLALLSPHKRCGKTTLLGVLSRLVPRPLLAANVTAAAVFRTVEAARPVLLADEADNFLGRDEMLGILNRGHRRGGRVIRTVGDDREPRQFSTFAPAALAAIGRLPPTLQGRSIAVLARALPIPSA